MALIIHLTHILTRLGSSHKQFYRLRARVCDFEFETRRQPGNGFRLRGVGARYSFRADFQPALEAEETLNAGEGVLTRALLYPEKYLQSPLAHLLLVLRHLVNNWLTLLRVEELHPTGYHHRLAGYRLMLLLGQQQAFL